MTPPIDLKEIERRAFRSTFQDGLWDIFIGCVISQLAIAPLLNDLGLGDFWSSVVLLPFYGLVYLGLWAGKKFITAPRIGLAKYGRVRRAKIGLLTLILFLMLLAGVVVGILAFIGGTPTEWTFPTAIGAMLLAGFCLGAYLLDFTRLYLYGVLVGLSFPVGELLFRYAGASHHGFPIVFGFSAAIMVLTGLFLFSRFLRIYPVPVEGFDDNHP